LYYLIIHYRLLLGKTDQEPLMALKNSTKHVDVFPRISTSYASLPVRFFEKVKPTPVKKPSLIALNQPLADSLGLNLAALDDSHKADLFSGNMIASGSEPIALA
jgi:uncharacterized protein YdiU (UPF0061 family)